MRWPHAPASAAALAAGAIACLAAPAYALPVTVTGASYDDARRRLTLEVTGHAELRARQLDRRILLEIPDARLRGRTLAQAVGGPRVRSLLVTEVAGRPPFVRVEIALAPGIEPVLSIHQTGTGRVYVTLGDPPPAEGERDFERHPARPAGTLPALEARGGAARPQAAPIGVPEGLEVPVPPVRPVMPVAVATPPPVAPPGSPPVAVRAAPAAAGPVLPKSLGSRPYALLTFQQVEASENIPGKRLHGFPTGPAGLEVQHWLWDFVGLGLEARYLSWTGKGDISLNRQEALVVVRAGARLPIPLAEPDLHVAGVQRYEVAPTHTGIDTPALALGGGVRFLVVDGLSLRLWGQLFPFGLGADQVWRAGASVLVDAGPALLSLGYTHDDKAVLGGKAVYEGAVVGAGIQW